MRADAGLAIGAAAVALAVFISPAFGSEQIEERPKLRGPIYEDAVRVSSSPTYEAPIYVATLWLPESDSLPVAGTFGVRSDGCSFWKRPRKLSHKLGLPDEQVKDPVELSFLKMHFKDLVRHSKSFTDSEREYVYSLCKD